VPSGLRTFCDLMFAQFECKWQTSSHEPSLVDAGVPEEVTGTLALNAVESARSSVMARFDAAALANYAGLAVESVVS
jgi:hypothetical protein